jgi:uncharacterized cupredoxin-like copper-binding protein
MKLTYQMFESPATIPALAKLYTNDNYEEFKTAYKVKRLCDALEKELKVYREMKQKAGNDASKLEELHAIEFEVKWDKLTHDEIKHVKLAPSDIGVLEYVVDFEG